jgi:hypothetical protein
LKMEARKRMNMGVILLKLAKIIKYYWTLPRYFILVFRIS